MDVPMLWPGTNEEREHNRRSHSWSGGVDGRCWNCDCRPGSVTADWPCGVEPPRGESNPMMLLTVGHDLMDALAVADEPEPPGLGRENHVTI